MMPKALNCQLCALYVTLLQLFSFHWAYFEHRKGKRKNQPIKLKKKKLVRTKKQVPWRFQTWASVQKGQAGA